jgi:hypothetical protein
MGHYLKECLNLLALSTKKNVGSFIRKFFIEKKGKTQVHLIELMSERRKKTLMGLEKSLKILENVIDIMTQIKQLMEDITHFNVSVKKFKEMVKAPKKKKKSRRWRFRFQNFPMFKDFGPYLLVKGVGS